MTADEIITAVAEVYDVPISSLMNERRRPFTEARRMAIYICSHHILASNSSTLAEIFHRSRSTVIHSINAAKCLLASDRQFYERYRQCVKRLKIVEFT